MSAHPQPEGDYAGLPTTADRARSAIRASGLPQRKVARLMDVDETKLSKSLRGARRFQPVELFQLATVTGVSVAWLLDSSAPPAAAAQPQTPAQRGRAHDQRRLSIVAQAWWLFAERGYAGVTMNDIAQSTRLSTATLHYYFATKRDLFDAALRYSVKLAYDKQVAELALIDDPLERLRRLFDIQMPDGELGRAEWSIWMQTWATIAIDGLHADHTDSYGRWYDTVRTIIADGSARGIFAVADIDETAAVLTTYVDGLGIHVMTGLNDANTMRRRIDEFIASRLLAPDVTLRLRPPRMPDTPTDSSTHADQGPTAMKGSA